MKRLASDHMKTSETWNEMCEDEDEVNTINDLENQTKKQRTVIRQAIELNRRFSKLNVNPSVLQGSENYQYYGRKPLSVNSNDMIISECVDSNNSNNTTKYGYGINDPNIVTVTKYSNGSETISYNFKGLMCMNSFEFFE
jgi:hypothetical protein